MVASERPSAAKGERVIYNFRLPIANLYKEIGNWQLAIGNLK
jgi:hypothetical protein